MKNFSARRASMNVQTRLTTEGFQLVVKVKDGPLESLTVPGFIIPVRAIFDDAQNRAALQQLL